MDNETTFLGFSIYFAYLHCCKHQMGDPFVPTPLMKVGSHSHTKQLSFAPSENN
jgi:hypothetical protein